MVKKSRPRLFYGWIIVGLLALSMTLAYATRSSFSVFYVAILDEYGWTRAETAGIFSLSLIVYGVGGIISGFLLDRLGPRKLFPLAASLIAAGALWCSRANEIWQFYVAFGLIVGFGQCCLGYVPTMAIVGHWFIKQRGLAAGIAMLGLSFSFLLSPLTHYLRETVGWRVAFVIFAAAVFIIVVPLASVFMRRRPQDMGLLPNGANELAKEHQDERSQGTTTTSHKWTSIEWTLLRAFRTQQLWLLLGIATMMGIIANFPQVHQIAYITDMGYSSTFAVTTLSLFGLLNGTGPFGGFISDRIGREKCSTLGAISMVISMAAALSVKQTGTEWFWYISAVSYGLGIGLLAPTLPATYSDLFAGKNLGSIIGFINMGFGLGGAAGPYLAGYIYDVSGNYTPSFFMIIGAAATLVTLMWLVSPRKIRPVTSKKG